jgi:hypothetical protein
LLSTSHAIFSSHAGSVEQGIRARSWAAIAASLDGSVLRVACSSGLRRRRKVWEDMLSPSIRHGIPCLSRKRASYSQVAGELWQPRKTGYRKGGHPKVWLTDGEEATCQQVAEAPKWGRCQQCGATFGAGDHGPTTALGLAGDGESGRSLRRQTGDVARASVHHVRRGYRARPGSACLLPELLCNAPSGSHGRSAP